MTDKDTASAQEHDLLDGDEYRIYTREVKARYHNVYLGETIESSDTYYDLFNLLHVSTQMDHVNIVLNNYGGRVNAGVQLINAIRATKAKVQMEVSAPVYSMGSLLAVVGDATLLHPHTFLMFHDYSGGERGKGNEMERSVTNYRGYFRSLLQDVCKDFLDKEEINTILNGQDLYIGYNDAKKRLKASGKLGK